MKLRLALAWTGLSICILMILLTAESCVVPWWVERTTPSSDLIVMSMRGHLTVLSCPYPRTANMPLGWHLHLSRKIEPITINWWLPAGVNFIAVIGHWSFNEWLLTLMTAILAITAWMLRKKHHTPGHCSTCGYDLRATPNQCPECGNITQK